MPNHCWNKITITGSENDIAEFIKNEFKDVPDWALTVHEKRLRGIYFDIWSRWVADFEWLESLLVKYPSVWVKDLWKSEDGESGVWIGSNEGIRRLEWDENPYQDWD